MTLRPKLRINGKKGKIMRFLVVCPICGKEVGEIFKTIFPYDRNDLTAFYPCEHVEIREDPDPERCIRVRDPVKQKNVSICIKQ